MTLGCNYEASHFGARYPDATCIDGYLWDLDSCDEPGGELCGGGDIPCPYCNSIEFVRHGRWSEFPGNAHQRRKAARAEARKAKAWAERRSSFPPAARSPA